MRRHIQVVCTLNADLATCTLVVASMTHYRNSPGGFSHEVGTNSFYFFAGKSKVRLSSCNTYEKIVIYNQPRDGSMRVYLPMHAKATHVATIKAEDWPRIKQAIEEYNERYKED